MSKRMQRRAMSAGSAAVGNKMAKLRPHIEAVEAQSHAWKLKYKAETGSLRGRIRQLEVDRNQLEEAVDRLAGNYHPVAGGCICTFCEYVRSVRLKVKERRAPTARTEHTK